MEVSYRTEIPQIVTNQTNNHLKDFEKICKISREATQQLIRAATSIKHTSK